MTKTEKIDVPCVRYAYRGIHVVQHPRKQLVGEDAGSIIETKETVVREDRPDSHVVSVQYALMRKR